MNSKIKAVRLLKTDIDPKLSIVEREALEVLRRRGGDMWILELAQFCGTYPSSTLDALVQLGYIAIY